MLVVAVVALAVAWSVFDGASRSIEARRRIGLLGQLGPATPAGRYVPRAPVTKRRLVGAAVTAGIWLTATTAAAIAWGAAPITFFVGLLALLYGGDLIAVARRRG